MRSWTRGFVVAVVLLAAAACGAAAPPAPGPSATPREPAVVRFEAKECTLRELFKQISRQTGISIVYDATDVKFDEVKLVCWLGTHAIPADDLFDWLQAVLSYRNLVVVPVGPAPGKHSPRWVLIERRALVGRPPYIEATDIDRYADRRDLYVVTTIRLSPTSDAPRIRYLLSALLTPHEGLGRIHQVPGSHDLIVGDFAPVVAQAVRLAAVLEEKSIATDSSREATPR